MGVKHLDKRCGRCEKWKRVEEFYRQKSGTHGRDGYCKQCRRERDHIASDKRKKSGPRIYSPEISLQRRIKGIKKNYGLGWNQYLAMFEEQQGLCAICEKPETSGRRGEQKFNLCVDHDHTTGKVRALLCTSCNKRLGVIENRKFLKRALRYLKQHSEENP